MPDAPIPPGQPRKKLAIVSSWNENCGNASYTYALKREFERHYDVTILPLDLFLLQKKSRVFVRLGDEHIDEMAKSLAGFDYVNIQFEAGLYGARIDDMRRRILRLLDAAPNVILTMHRVDLPTATVVGDFWEALYNLDPKRFFANRYRAEFPALYEDIVLHARRLAARKNVWIMVHTKRERRVVEAAFKMRNVVDFPLAFLDAETRRRTIDTVDPEAIRQRYSLPPGAKTIGAFGYIAEYKGFELLIEAISVLPPDWYLIVAGSQHPQSVQAWSEIDPYLDLLLQRMTGRSFRKAIVSGAAEPEKARRHRTDFRDLSAGLRVNASVADLSALRDDARALMDRVRFIGNVDDDEFTFLLRNVDATVLPYLEVGQSMSGVVSLAIESGARLFCSNNLSFAEARRYFGQVFGNFDIGNYVEVAQKVQFDRTDYTAARERAYARYNISRSIDLHRHLFEHHAPPAPGWIEAAWIEAAATESTPA